jgi:hypothetical protein
VVIQDHFLWEEIQQKVNCGSCASSHAPMALELH